jgi:alpha-glucosidase
MNCESISADNEPDGKPKRARTPGRYVSHAVSGTGVLITARNASVNVGISPLGIIRITYLHSPVSGLSTTPAVTGWNGQASCQVIESGRFLKILSGSMEVEVEKTDMLVTIRREGKTIAEDLRPFKWTGGQVMLSQRMSPGDFIYGLGEKTGFMNKRGRKYTMWNSDEFNAHNTTIDPLYLSIPFFINFNPERVYGLYLDNPYRSVFEMGEGGKDDYQISAEGGQMDYYLITGNSMREIIRGYASLTGTTPMPPRWSIGHHQSRYSYKSEEEVLEIAGKFRTRDIPCDAIHLDIHFMDGYRVFTWDDENYPDPSAMSANLLEAGIRLVSIADPGIKVDSGYGLYLEAVGKGLCCKYPDGRLFTGKAWPGESVFPDFTLEAARRWWGGKTLEFMEKFGISGIWHDMNEPAVFSAVSTMDPDVYHGGDGDGGTHLRYHNLYGFLQNKGVYESSRRRSDERPFILTRAGFAGIQRYAAVWTGDNRSMWEHLELSIPMILNMGLSGLVFTGADIGGFVHHSNGELLVRWYQAGVFAPFFRNHCEAHAYNQEPWSFGEKYEAIIRDAIRFRYALAAELYNLFFAAYRTGLPVMRPLVLDYPGDPAVYSVCDQFLFGDSLLVATVIRPGVDHRMVYLPQGGWHDLYSGERFEGKSRIIVDAPLERIPVFLKGGSIIPFNDPGPSMEQIPRERLTFAITFEPGIERNSYRNYGDDGHTFAYEGGTFFLEEISYEKSPRDIKIRKKVLNNGYPCEYERYRFSLRNVPAIREISADNRPVAFERVGRNLEFEVGSAFMEIDIRL